jgi:iron(III) transport system substrate-binding protein
MIELKLLAVAAGEADLAVANTYYLALMLSGKKGAEQQAAAKKVYHFFLIKVIEELI